MSSGQRKSQSLPPSFPASHSQTNGEIQAFRPDAASPVPDGPYTSPGFDSPTAAPHPYSTGAKPSQYGVVDTRAAPLSSAALPAVNPPPHRPVPPSPLAVHHYA